MLIAYLSCSHLASQELKHSCILGLTASRAKIVGRDMGYNSVLEIFRRKILGRENELPSP